MDLGERLKILLKEKHLSAYQLGVNAGVSSSLVSRCLNDEKSNPSLDTIEKLAKGLGVSMAYLFGEAPTANEVADCVLVMKVELFPDGSSRQGAEGLYVHRKTLEKAGALYATDLDLIDMSEDTMKPILSRGDQLICIPMPETDGADYIDNGCIYIFLSGKHLYCGYMQRNFNGSLSIWTETDKEKQIVAPDMIRILYKVIIRIGAV